ncbi:30S ribosomal protein S20 [Kyrpidia spormannii]|uniref:Small ribosomal subunit protein bS20 n=1 Tax=Kyrpidia spormannii TaxID=2055160 RepID=A0A2K8N8R8_9BACL|nr:MULTISPECIES: 30S ribosomal protein S20 [Kyrpidia]ATY85217.1 30S ribosomal protein S20 [Kyrpidia spormannii]MCL6575876.1 30S ribosomal protein S20 [Kyrpidia sp.]
MPNIKSAIKRVQITRKRTLRNASLKSMLRTSIKKFHVTLQSGNLEAAERQLREAIRRIDKSVTKGILHRNAAARKKSRLTRKFQAAVKEQQTQQTA